MARRVPLEEVDGDPIVWMRRVELRLRSYPLMVPEQEQRVATYRAALDDLIAFQARLAPAEAAAAVAAMLNERGLARLLALL